MKSPEEFLVTDRKSFAEFLELLIADLKENPNKWSNNNLEDFLHALGSYTEDIDGYYSNFKININADNPSWRTFADIFLGARIYEY